MKAWLRHHAQSLAATLSRLAQAPLASTLNALVIGIALALPLGGYALLASLKALSGGLATEPQVSVFLAPEAGRGDVAELDKRLRAMEGVASVRFVPRDAALTSLKAAPGMADVIGSLRDNPLPDAFVVTLRDRDPALSGRTEAQARALPKVAHVQVDAAWIQRLDALIRIGRVAVALLGTLLAIALVAVTFNTIRLQILTQRDEIEVSKLVGATDSTVRRPFFYLGGVLGLAGGAIGMGIVFGALYLLNREVGRLAVQYGSDFSLTYLGWVDVLSVLAFATLLGWFGAFMSVSKHLWQIQPK